MTLHLSTADPVQRARGLALAPPALRRGQLVGLPLDSTYGIAVDAFSTRGADDLRAAKGRPDLRIPVMVPRIATVSGLAQVGPAARDLMRAFWPGPLTLVLRAHPTLDWTIADGLGRIAVRMPLYPVALELLARTGPLGVVTGIPGATTPEDAFAEGLMEYLAILLDAGAMAGGPGSAVVDLTGAQPVLLRGGPIDPAELRAACPDLVGG